MSISILPNELIGRIAVQCGFIAQEDVNNMRLVCRSWAIVVPAYRTHLCINVMTMVSSVEYSLITAICSLAKYYTFVHSVKLVIGTPDKNNRSFFAAITLLSILGRLFSNLTDLELTFIVTTRKPYIELSKELAVSICHNHNLRSLTLSGHGPTMLPLSVLYVLCNCPNLTSFVAIDDEWCQRFMKQITMCEENTFNSSISYGDFDLSLFLDNGRVSLQKLNPFCRIRILYVPHIYMSTFDIACNLTNIPPMSIHQLRTFTTLPTYLRTISGANLYATTGDHVILYGDIQQQQSSIPVTPLLFLDELYETTSTKSVPDNKLAGLTVYNTNVRPALLSRIKRFTELEELRFFNLKDSFITLEVAISRRRLAAENNDHHDPFVDMADCLANMHKLRKLTLSGFSSSSYTLSNPFVPPQSVKCPATLAFLYSSPFPDHSPLTHIHLDRINGASQPFVTSILRLPLLQSLSLCNGIEPQCTDYGRNTKTVINIRLIRSPHLRKLSFNGCHIVYAAGLENVNACSGSATRTPSTLYNFTEKGLNAISLVWCDAEYAAFSYILNCSLASLRSLEIVHLTDMSDVHMRHIGKLRRLTSLILNASQNPKVTPCMLIHIAYLSRLRVLHWIVGGAHDVSLGEACTVLGHAYPFLHVLRLTDILFNKMQRNNELEPFVRFMPSCSVETTSV
jgi:hypothetical protein